MRGEGALLKNYRVTLHIAVSSRSYPLVFLLSDTDYSSDSPADVTREITRSTVVTDVKAEEGQEFVIELDCDGNKLKLSALSDEDKGIWKSAIQDIIRARIAAAVTESEAPKPPTARDDPAARSTLDKDSRAGLMAALAKQGPHAGGRGGGDRGGLLAAIAKRGSKSGSGSGAESGSDARDSSSGGRSGLLAAIAKRGSAGDRGSTTEKPDSGGRGGLLAAIQARKAGRDSTSGSDRGSGAAAPPPASPAGGGGRGGLLAAIQARNKANEES